MDYEKFIRAMSECTKAQLSEGETMELQRILKNNGVARIGLAIRREGQRIAPLIYLEEYYERYLSGERVEDLTKLLLAQRAEAPMSLEWDCECFSDFSEIKDKIVFKLINTEKNKVLLEELPYFPVLDFSMVFYVTLPVFEVERGAVLIKKQHLKFWGITPSVLYHCAMENTPKLLPYHLASLSEFLSMYLSECDGEQDVFVLTNEQGVNGAAALLYPQMSKIILEKVGGDYYLLPASVHEFLIVPKKRGIEPEALEEMVREINRTQISEEEFLSDHIYQFLEDNITKM